MPRTRAPPAAAQATAAASRFTTWLFSRRRHDPLMHLQEASACRRQPRCGRPNRRAHFGTPGRRRHVDGQLAQDQAIARRPSRSACQRLDTMGDKYGDVFLMRFRDGYSESEIAQKLKRLERPARSRYAPTTLGPGFRSARLEAFSRLRDRSGCGADPPRCQLRSGAHSPKRLLRSVLAHARTGFLARSSSRRAPRHLPLL